MKTSCIFLVACILIPIHSWSQPTALMAAETNPAPWLNDGPSDLWALCTQFDGASLYDLPDVEGMFFAANGRVMWMLFPKDRKALDPATASIQEKARAFEGLNFMVGTWTCEGNRGTVTYEYTADPNLAGTSFSFDFQKEGSLNRYWVIGTDGTRADEGRSYQIAGLQDPSACGHKGGFWRYEMPDSEGYYGIAGSYVGWVNIDKAFWADPPDLSTDAGKAAAYDAFLVSAGTYACDGQGNWSYNLTYSKNPDDATHPFFLAVDTDGPVTRWWSYDTEGNRIEPEGRAVKVE